MKRLLLFAAVALFAVGCGSAPVSKETSLGDRWTLFRDFWFEANRAELPPSEMGKVFEIAAHVKQHPTVNIRIDGSGDSSGTLARNNDLSNRRVDAVRDALIHAGVPPTKIQTGPFGHARLDRRVEVLISAAP